MFKTLSRIHEHIEKLRTQGSKPLDGIGELLSPLTHPDLTVRWQHCLLDPMTHSEILTLEKELGKPFPKDLRTFYRNIGGISLFGGSFLLAGHKTNTGEDQALGFHPATLCDLDKQLAHVGDLADHALAIGRLSWDESLLVYPNPAENRTVCRIHAYTGEKIDCWDELWSCLLNRLLRMEAIAEMRS